MNTNYLLRTPEFGEVRKAFGTLAHAVVTTAGDIPTLCFYLANQDRIPAADAKPVSVGATDFSRKLMELAADEAAADAFKAMEKPTIVGAAKATGLSRYAVRAALVRAGLWVD